MGNAMNNLATSIERLTRYQDDHTGMQSYENGEYLRRDDVIAALAATPAVDIILRDEEDRLRDVEGLRMGDVAMMFTRLRERLTATPAVGGEELREMLAAAWLYGHCRARGFTFAETDIPGCKGSFLWGQAMQDAVAIMPAAQPASTLRGVSGNEDLRNSIQRYIFDGAARDISPYDTATNILLFLAAQPASPLRGRDRDLIALDAAHQIEALPRDLHEAQKTARIQLIALDALSASAPEQPAVQLQARKIGQDEWIDIYPAQVEAMSKAGHNLRAIEQVAALPLTVRLRDEAGPPLPQMIAQRRAQLSQEQPAAAPVTEREWCAIDTAPKDGTHLLLAADGYKKVRVGWFFKNSWHWDGEYSGVPFGKQPTHWQPLPEFSSTTPKTK